MPDDARRRLEALGLSLPAPPAALGSYVPFVVSGDLVLTSGVLPMRDGALAYRGSLGGGVSLEDGIGAARLCALNLLTLAEAAAGSLDGVAQVLQLVAFVRSAPGFDRQPAVVNGASDLLVDVLGERGRHARIAVGVGELPLGAPVEISGVLRLSAVAGV